MKTKSKKSCRRVPNFAQWPRGFTLIELMIVVSIIGILAAAASPVYLDYVIRGQVSDGVNLATGAKTAVALHYLEHGTFPADNNAAALAPTTEIRGKYVVSVSVSGPLISIRFGNKANSQILGETITLKAEDQDGSVSWACASGGVIRDKYLPRVCR